MTLLIDQQYKRFFKSSPGKTLVLRAGNFEIVAVTDEYLRATKTRESDLIGKALFELFPDDPNDPEADGVESLSASLARVQALKAPDIMPVQRYPLPLPDGTFEERFWSPVNSPVLDEAGEVEFIMHRVEDVTPIVRDNPVSKSPAGDDSNHLAGVQDIILRSKELRRALSKLQESQIRMRIAERMLHLGTWEYNPATSELNWSQQVFDIYDIPYDQKAPNAEEYFAMLHPDDQKRSLAIYKAFVDKRLPKIEFGHRVVTRDGAVRHVKGVGERLSSAEGEVVVGYVQDVTSLVETQQSLTQAENLLRLAGEKARLGGWRVELDTLTVIWTPGTAIIHGLPADYSPASVEEAINYYAPEYREVIQRVFQSCTEVGRSFDEVCRLRTPDGRQPWVRSIGMAEYDEHGKIIAVQGAFQDISSLLETQARADAAEQQTRDVLESISDAFFAVDEDWVFTYLNQSACEALDRSREELLGKNVWEEFPEALGSEFERQYRLAVDARQTVRFQASYPPLDKWFDVSAYPTPDGLAVYFRDVTLERDQQERLRLKNAALSRQNDIVMITTASPLDDPAGPSIVYVNEAFERVTGFTQSEAIGRTPRILQGPETDRAQLDRIRHAIENKESIRCEVRNLTKSGKPFWLELDITPLFDEQGVCTHFVAVERDVTERKQLDTELREAQERFELISRATNDVIWDWDLVTNKVWWNDSMTEAFGYPLDVLEPGPESWTSRIHPDDRERVLEGIYHVIDGEDEYWHDDYRFIMSGGESAHVIDRGFVLRDETGKAIRMVGSILNITERKEMEQRLRESQKLEAVGHLTGGVAHDFNNLLTVILGNAEMLTEQASDPQLRSMAGMTLSAAQRGAELTSRLLAFARRQPLNPKPADLNKQVEAMHALIRRTLPEHIELQFALDPELGITEIDTAELDTALLNLVVNARDAMQGGGKLTIETTNTVLDDSYASQHPGVEPGEYVALCVSDTGIGMTPDTVRRAFEPFFTTKSVGKGSGLGLSMVFGFTKQSGGHINIYSEPGEGTSVKLYFPMVRDATQSNHESVLAPEPAGGTEHILVVEDDSMVLQHLESQLRSLGYRVTATESGPEALRALEESPDIDLLLTDIVMPGGMNGRELADRARTLYPALKVLFTSGYTENAIVHHGRLDPGVDLLSKPYTRLELASKVRLVIEGLAT